MKRYNFSRYHSDLLMAEGIAVHASSMADAVSKASSLADPLDNIEFLGYKKCPERNELDRAKGLQCPICHPPPSIAASTEEKP